MRKLFKDSFFLLTLQLLSPMTLDIINLHNLTEIVQIMSYASSAILSVVGSVYSYLKIKQFLHKSDAENGDDES